LTFGKRQKFVEFLNHSADLRIPHKRAVTNDYAALTLFRAISHDIVPVSGDM